MWRITKSFRKPVEAIPTISKNNITYLTDKEKADIVSETLENIQKNKELSNKEREVRKTIDDFFYDPTPIDYTKIHLTTPKEIKEIIRQMPNNKAPGADKIDNKLLKNLPRKTIVQLMYLLNGI